MLSVGFQHDAAVGPGIQQAAKPMALRVPFEQVRQRAASRARESSEGHPGNRRGSSRKISTESPG